MILPINVVLACMYIGQSKKKCYKFSRAAPHRQDATINAMRHRYNILATVIANFSTYCTYKHVRQHIVHVTNEMFCSSTISILYQTIQNTIYKIPKSKYCNVIIAMIIWTFLHVDSPFIKVRICISGTCLWFVYIAVTNVILYNTVCLLG